MNIFLLVSVVYFSSIMLNVEKEIVINYPSKYFKLYIYYITVYLYFHVVSVVCYSASLGCRINASILMFFFCFLIIYA